MPDLTVESNLDVNPITRSNVYRLLSAGFKYPKPEIFDALKNGTFMEELWESLASLSHVGKLLEKKDEINQKINHGLENLTYSDFEGKYISTFEVGTPKPPCPPYEGLFREKEGEARPAIMIEISEFYKQFGLLISKEEGKKELPDHLSAELEFLHFLTFKESQARSEDDQDLLKGYILAQKDFHERHLTKWISGFKDKVESSDSLPLFVCLADITKIFIECEFELTNSMLKEMQ